MYKCTQGACMLGLHSRPGCWLAFWCVMCLYSLWEDCFRKIQWKESREVMFFLLWSFCLEREISVQTGEMAWGQVPGSCLPSGRCPGNAFSCGNSQCVTKVNPECDDTSDCSDGSDEAHCGQSACLNWPTGHIAFPGSAAGSALWPTVPITCCRVGLAFTEAGQRKGGSTCDMTRNVSRKQRRESSRCVGEKGRYQADKRSWSNCGKPRIPGTGGLSCT